MYVNTKLNEFTYSIFVIINIKYLNDLNHRFTMCIETHFLIFMSCHQLFI